jgi:cell division cycle 14
VRPVHPLGLNHYDMYFADGGNPTDAILKRFLEVAENEKGALAVHCKAGLGRTGTLISLYLMKHFGLTTPEVISWLRLCRPGSVIGPQQNFLQDMEKRMWREVRVCHLNA